MSVLTVLATAFACGSSDSDDSQASAGTSSVGGAAGRSAGSAASAGSAGSAGAMLPSAGEDGLGGAFTGAAGDNGGQAGESASAGEDAGGQGGQAGQREQSEPAGQGGQSGEAGMAGAQADSGTLELSGAFTHVHDPDIIKDGDTFYLFSTGEGVQVRTSTDLKYWVGAGQVFASKPSWITTTDPSDPNNLWAPEVLYFGGTFHLYYAASKFGSNQSCIGHATKATLGSTEPWVDLGAAYCSNSGGPAQDFNAIDPNPFQDEQGDLWLGFGSFWSGLKLVQIDGDGLVDGSDLFSLATRANTAVEAPHLQFHAGFYFSSSPSTTAVRALRAPTRSWWAAPKTSRDPTSIKTAPCSVTVAARSSCRAASAGEGRVTTRSCRTGIATGTFTTRTMPTTTACLRCVSPS